MKGNIMSQVLNVYRSASEWTTDNPVLGPGQVGVEKYTNKVKVGNGVSHWVELKYLSSAPDPVVLAVGNAGSVFTVPDLVGGLKLVTATLNANCTPVFPTPRAGFGFQAVLAQDATGSRLVTWPASVKWPAGTAPTLTTTANKRDRLEFLGVDSSSWLGRVVAQNYS